MSTKKRKKSATARVHDALLRHFRGRDRVKSLLAKEFPSGTEIVVTIPSRGQPYHGWIWELREDPLQPLLVKLKEERALTELARYVAEGYDRGQFWIPFVFIRRADERARN